jgi:hypothetical protein
MTIIRQTSADCRYRTYGPWFTTATVTGVEWAFTEPQAEPTGGDWQTGIVEQDPDDDTRYTFSILVSGVGENGTVELVEGDYRIWVKVAQPPEEIVNPIGMLTVY